jgi:predicted nucleic acid-binding protein
VARSCLIRVLLTYLALRYLDSIRAAKPYRDAIFHDIRGEDHPFGEDKQERLDKLMSVGGPALTTAHVMVEVTKMREHSELARASGFGVFSLNLLAGTTITETTYSVGELCKEPMFLDITRRFGLTDAGLIRLAHQNECLLLTDDSRLYGAYPAGSRCDIQLLDEYLREPT